MLTPGWLYEMLLQIRIENTQTWTSSDCKGPRNSQLFCEPGQSISQDKKETLS